jgi:hypothetical protein
MIHIKIHHPSDRRFDYFSRSDARSAKVVPLSAN